MRNLWLLVLFLLPCLAFAETETFTVQASMNVTAAECDIVAPANLSWHNTSFDVQFKAWDGGAMDWVALYERNDSSGSWGAWSVVSNVSSPGNGTIYTFNHSAGGAYSLQYFCNVSVSAVYNSSSAYTFYLDTVLPQVMWTFPLDDFSSTNTYGIDWLVNVSVTDRNLQYCNLTVRDGAGVQAFFNCTYAIVLAGNDTCDFLNLVDSEFHEIGNWSFNVYAVDNASNFVNETVYAWLFSQNTSHSVWSRGDDPYRTREWVITEGMQQTITAFYHTPGQVQQVQFNQTEYDYEVYGAHRNSDYAPENAISTAPIGAVIAWWDSDFWYRGTIFDPSPAPGANEYRVEFLDMDTPGANWSNLCQYPAGIGATHFPGHQFYVYAGVIHWRGWARFAHNATHEKRLWRSAPIDNCSDVTVFATTYELDDGSSNEWRELGQYYDGGTSLWSLKHNFSAGSCANLKNPNCLYLVERNAASTDLISVNLLPDNTVNYTGTVRYADIFNNYGSWWVAFHQNATGSVWVYQFNETTFEYISHTKLNQDSGDQMAVMGFRDNDPYIYAYKANSTGVSDSDYGYMMRYGALQNVSGIEGATCTFTCAQQGFDTEPMTEVGGGLYTYTYTEALGDNQTVWYAATCRKGGHENVTDPGLYHTGNWHTPRGFVSLDRYYPAPTYYDNTTTLTNKMCVPIDVEGRDIDIGATIELYAYYPSAVSGTANMTLYVSDSGRLGDLDSQCTFSKGIGWKNCTANVTDSWIVGEDAFVCIDNGSGVGTLSGGGSAYRVGSWIAMDEVLISTQSPWNLASTVAPTVHQRKYLVATDRALYTTDFVDKQLHLFATISAPWNITHISVDFENNIIVRLKNTATGACKARRYGYYGSQTNEQTVDCADTQSGIHYIRDKYWAAGQGGIFKSDSLTGFVRHGADLGSRFSCTNSQIEYKDNGNAYLACSPGVVNITYIWRLEYAYAPLPWGDIVSANISKVAWIEIGYNDWAGTINEWLMEELWRQDGVINNTQAAFFSDPYSLDYTVMYHDYGSSKSIVKHWGETSIWVGGTELSGTDWVYGLLGYDGTWVFAKEDGGNSFLSELDRGSGKERYIYNPLLSNFVAATKFSPGVLSYIVYKDYVDINKTSGTCVACDSIHLNDVITSIRVRKVWDKEKQRWTKTIVPGMTVKVYIDGAFQHEYEMAWNGNSMASIEEHSIPVTSGSKVTLKFYSYDILQTTLDYEVSKGELLLRRYPEVFEFSEGVFFPNPWYYNGSIYVIPYLNNYDTPLRTDVLSDDVNLTCNSWVNYETGGTTPLIPTLEYVGGYYAFKMAKPAPLDVSENITLQVRCWIGDFVRDERH